MSDPFISSDKSLSFVMYEPKVLATWIREDNRCEYHWDIIESIKPSDPNYPMARLLIEARAMGRQQVIDMLTTDNTLFGQEHIFENLIRKAKTL